LAVIAHDSKADGAGRNQLRDRVRDLRIVDRFLAVRAEIPHGVSLIAKVGLEFLFELESAVVGAQSNW
jgi:hypothetical protein